MSFAWYIYLYINNLNTKRGGSVMNELLRAFLNFWSNFLTGEFPSFVLFGEPDFRTLYEEDK